MISAIYLQTEVGVAAIIAIIIAAIISFIFYAIQKRSFSKLKEKLSPLTNIDPKIQYDVSRMQTDLQTVSTNVTNLTTNLPHTNEVTAVQENVQQLCTDFTELKTSIDDQMNKIQLVTTEDLNKTRDQMIKDATEKITEHANNHLIQNSVSRDEFEKLKERIEKVLGADEVAERMDILTSIFDSTQIKTLNWQCRLIKLLTGGLAPEAEEDLIVTHGIPKSSSEKFLKKLTELGVSESRKISAFYLVPDYEWLYSYVESPDWLQQRLESTVKKESEYQQYIRDHLNLIEEGLLLESAEYELATGKIDFLCRDSSGKAVGLELKYPAATSSAKRQIMGYRKDYQDKTGSSDARFILVAPKIPEKVKLLLVNDGFEYKEIEF